MAALWMARCGIKTLVVDKRDVKVRAGHADGIQCRTLEILESFDLVDRIWKESCHMAENPGNDGLIHRSSRMSNTIPGLSRFPCGVLLAQHRIEDIFLEEIHKCSTVEIRRNVEPTSIHMDNKKIHNHNAHAVTVELQRTAMGQSKPVMSNGNTASNWQSGESQHAHMDQSQTSNEKVRARYVIGCDGAHSWTRAQLGFCMEGEQTEYLSTMVISNDGRFDRSSITPETILQAAQKIMKPYKLEYKHRDWWTVYQIGQRVGNQFTAEDRIFLAGDAIHTHSPKAGQGMNVSIQDTYNLGWKLAMVVKGLAKPSILKTYETERRGIAKELIAFDQEYSRLWSSRPKKDTEDQDGLSMVEFERAFVKQQLFSSGFGVHYSPSILMAKSSDDTIEMNGSRTGAADHSNGDVVTSNQNLATRTILGQRFPSFKVINHSDARSWHLATWLPSDGLFHILLFAGDVSQSVQMNRVRIFAAEIAARSHMLPLQRRQRPRKSPRPRHFEEQAAVARLLTIHSAPRQAIEMHDFPSLLFPYDEELGYDYNCIFVDGESYYEGHGRAYEGYGINPKKGCVVLVRPDQHVAWIGELEDVQGLERYFKRILVEP
ncbi:MAG: hypothetical protein Q9204_007226 [Flavoplaca sp. TL-2023a]